MQQAKTFQVPPCPSHMRVLNQVWSRLILYQATVHDEHKMLSSHCAWSQQLRSNWLIGSIFWKAFQYEYKWSYPQKIVSEPTHWLRVNYYRPKVKPCQDEQTLVKGAYKNQLNRVPTKVTDTNLTYRQTHVSIQWNLNAYPYPTRQVSKVLAYVGWELQHWLKRFSHLWHSLSTQIQKHEFNFYIRHKLLVRT